MTSSSYPLQHSHLYHSSPPFVFLVHLNHISILTLKNKLKYLHQPQHSRLCHSPPPFASMLFVSVVCHYRLPILFVSSSFSLTQSSSQIFFILFFHLNENIIFLFFCHPPSPYCLVYNLAGTHTLFRKQETHQQHVLHDFTMSFILDQVDMVVGGDNVNL